MRTSAGPIARPAISRRSLEGKVSRSVSVPCGGFCSKSCPCPAARPTKTSRPATTRTATSNSSTSPSCGRSTRNTAGRSSASTRKRRKSSAISSTPDGLSPTGRIKVQDHDFVTAEQRLVPYGVFDTVRNEGLMYLACGSDTSKLACDAVWRWWQRMGRRHYRYAPRLLLLSDCGGSNGNPHLRVKKDFCELSADMDV